jgi:hypothetical protein
MRNMMPVIVRENRRKPLSKFCIWMTVLCAALVLIVEVTVASEPIIPPHAFRGRIQVTPPEKKEVWLARAHDSVERCDEAEFEHLVKQFRKMANAPAPPYLIFLQREIKKCAEHKFDGVVFARIGDVEIAKKAKEKIENATCKHDTYIKEVDIAIKRAYEYSEDAFGQFTKAREIRAQSEKLLVESKSRADESRKLQNSNGAEAARLAKLAKKLLDEADLKRLEATQTEGDAQDIKNDGKVWELMAERWQSEADRLQPCGSKGFSVPKQDH